MVSLAASALLTLAACAPVRQPPGPGPRPPSVTPLFFHTADGLDLPAEEWRPNGTPAAVVVALHGFNDYRGQFVRIGPALAARGLLVYAYDQRGFGASPHPGIWPGTERLVDDAVTVARLLHERHPSLPVYYLGISMGAAVAMVALAERDPPVAGAVLTAPAVWGRKSIGRFGSALLDALAHAVPWYPASVSGIPIMATDNIPVLERMLRDPLVRKVTRTDTLWGLVNLMDAANEAAAHLRTPVMLQYGLKDDIVPRGPMRRVAAILADAPHARVAVYRWGHHMMLQDREAKPALDDIAAWIRNPGGPLPSGADQRALARLDGED